MKKVALAAGLVTTFTFSNSMAADFLVGDDLQKAFCGKTFMEGENFDSGWKFKVYYPEKCNEVTVHYVSGDQTGQRFTWPLRIYPSGDHCVKRDGKDRCFKIYPMGDGVYHAIAGNGKAMYSRSKPVEGNQLDK